MCSISTRGNTSWGCRLWKRCACAPGTALPRAEAVNIALHIVNAELEGSDLSSTLAAVEVLDEVTVLVERELGIALDRESYNYARFAMHIQFLVRRLSSGKVMEQGSGKMLSELSAEYPATIAVPKQWQKRSSSAMAGIAVRTRCCI